MLIRSGSQCSFHKEVHVKESLWAGKQICIIPIPLNLTPEFSLLLHPGLRSLTSISTEQWSYSKQALTVQDFEVSG